jgi:hypothetical protein
MFVSTVGKFKMGGFKSFERLPLKPGSFVNNNLGWQKANAKGIIVRLKNCVMIPLEFFR